MRSLPLLALGLIGVAFVPTVVAVGGDQDAEHARELEMTKLSLGPGKWTPEEKAKHRFDNALKATVIVPQKGRRIDWNEMSETRLGLHPSARPLIGTWDHKRLHVFNSHLLDAHAYDTVYRQQRGMLRSENLPAGAKALHNRILTTCIERTAASWDSACKVANGVVSPAVQLEMAKNAVATIDKLKQPVMRGDQVIEERPIIGGLYPPFTESPSKRPRHS